MDTMKLIGLMLGLVVGATNLPEQKQPATPDQPATALVAEWPQAETIPTPVAEWPQADATKQAVVTEQSSPFQSAEADELRQLSVEIKADAARLKAMADEQRVFAEGLKSYRPKPDSLVASTCDCDCPDEDRLRVILREELATALRERMNTAGASTSNGSSGGYLSQSNGSSGGSLSASSAGMPPVANPRMFGERLGREPLKVTIHKFANGQACSVCDRWLAEVAPQLQAMGVTVTQINDITTGSAPVIDACKGRDVCQRFSGYTDAATIMSSLQ